MRDEQRLKGRRLLRDFKGGSYAFGLQVLETTGQYAAELGQKAMVVANPGGYLKPTINTVLESLRANGVAIAGDMIVRGAAPNAPREDVYRLETYILHHSPDCLVVIGGGSTIDAVKGANVLAVLGRHNAEIEAYFGTDLVTQALNKQGRQLIPTVAVQTASGSGAHLTKYSNITDPVTSQKKLIIDNAIVPTRAVFDYCVTKSMPRDMTVDGAFDGLAHCLEVLYGISREHLDVVKSISLLGIELIVENLEKCVRHPNSSEAREAIGLAADLGGYAIMIGGTNGAHLTSFSLVDVASHGRACAIMNPYYTVFFAPAIEDRLRLVGEVYRRAGFVETDLDRLSGRDLGIAVAEGMMSLSKRVGYPTTLAELTGFTDAHIERALRAAKDPQLESKLRNMPVLLNASLVDKYMKPILEAAKEGDLSLIKNMD